ncbi:hypothetical protein [Marivita geojedonensis]|uniref:Uncharacterized protein n=1 Tax=Marivita geojedonensis TaxID=1123756 RepID=A0A1X4N984_9RHOB|nr:hypothetical protein [Marivita geojedonensis]OSQ42929.1 hypothetical protein MGEO_20110 [Marivita geojedonensis]PRY72129.1 hypothetical protein CLV76_13810 [Marivita geojedonensis]
MEDTPVHWGDAEFEEFASQELSGLAERAKERGICIDCLSDRLIFEVVVGLVKSGVSEQEIFDLVTEAIEEAENDDQAPGGTPPRIH